MEGDILQKFEQEEKKLEQIFSSVEKTRKYFMWTLIISLALFILPLIALLFVIPQFLSTYTNKLGL